MVRGYFPAHHWHDVLRYVADADDLWVNIEITEYSVIIDHTLVSFITETDQDVEFRVKRQELLTTDTQGMVEVSWDGTGLFTICDELADKRWVLVTADQGVSSETG